MQLKKLKYVFTTTKGARANLETIQRVLATPAYEGKMSFDVFDPQGMRHTLNSIDDLGKPEMAWLKK